MYIYIVCLDFIFSRLSTRAYRMDSLIDSATCDLAKET